MTSRNKKNRSRRSDKTKKPRRSKKGSGSEPASSQGRSRSNAGKGRRRSQKKGNHRGNRSGQGKRIKGHFQETLIATLDKNPKGFGFLVFDDRETEDLFLPPKWASAYLHGDRLKVFVNSKGGVEDLEIYERRSKELIGKYVTHPSKKHPGFLHYQSKRSEEEIPLTSQPQAKSGDWVRARIVPSENHKNSLLAEPVQVYGPDLPASADLDLICGEFNLTEMHSKEAIEQAKSYSFQINPKDQRKDLRDEEFITIDGKTARDFDDAILVKKLGGDYQLFVAIADVSHYVTPKSPIDDEAFQRATSIYFPERAFHMLPSELSENLCSLRPNEDRLALICEVAYKASGEKKSVKVYNGVIRSKRRATYEEIQKEYDENQKNNSWPFHAHFELFDILKKKRDERGSIEFDLPEAYVNVDAKGEPTEIETYVRKESHRLIEEFMIAANESVTEWAIEKKLPFIYRIHEIPSQESIEKFEELARSVGLNLNLKQAAQNPKKLAKLIVDLEDHPATLLLNMMLLRSMKQAIYSEVHEGHYGLASIAYTHFTSPIRRYPDLVVHRILKSAVIDGVEKTKKRFEEEHLSEAAKHSSQRERLADQAERLGNKLKQIRLMQKHLGEGFQGMIQGMNSKGLFIQIQSPFVEGFLPKERLRGDLYQFHEKKMIYQGNRSKKAFKIGDRLNVVIARSSLESREIELDLDLDDSTQNHPKKG